MTKREMMIKAHGLASKMVGNYSARLSLALRQLWASLKKGVAGVMDLKNEIDQAAEKMIGEMVKAKFSPEKVELNKNMLLKVVDQLKVDFDTFNAGELRYYSYNDAKTFVKNVYGMTGKFADHNSMKHRIAVSLSNLM